MIYKHNWKKSKKQITKNFFQFCTNS